MILFHDLINKIVITKIHKITINLAEATYEKLNIPVMRLHII